jgi:gentisate 1,2-dioxygenase
VGDRPQGSLFDRIVAQRVPPQKRVLRADDVPWNGNVRRLIDAQNGFENRAIASFLRRLPAGGASDIHRHSFEAIGYVLRGRGYELHDGERIDWSEGDSVLIPANVWHQHVNASPEEEAVLLLVTNAPPLLHLGICTMEPAESWEDVRHRPSAYPDPFLHGARQR